MNLNILYTLFREGHGRTKEAVEKISTASFVIGVNPILPRDESYTFLSVGNIF